MRFKRGSIVSYGGRAAEVLGVHPFTLPSGQSVDCLTLVYTGLSRALVRVPLDRVAERVTRISKHEAAALEANVPSVSWLAASRMQKARAAAAAKLADYGRAGGIAKARAAARA